MSASTSSPRVPLTASLLSSVPGLLLGTVHPREAVWQLYHEASGCLICGQMRWPTPEAADSAAVKHLGGGAVDWTGPAWALRVNVIAMASAQALEQAERIGDAA